MWGGCRKRQQRSNAESWCGLLLFKASITQKRLGCSRELLLECCATVQSVTYYTAVSYTRLLYCLLVCLSVFCVVQAAYLQLGGQGPSCLGIDPSQGFSVHTDDWTFALTSYAGLFTSFTLGTDKPAEGTA